MKWRTYGHNSVIYKINMTRCVMMLNTGKDLEVIWNKKNINWIKLTRSKKDREALISRKGNHLFLLSYIYENKI